MATLFRISQIAKRTGKTTRAIRFYEELGIVSPQHRTEAGYRMSGEESILRIQWIDKLHELGFSLPEIQQFLQSFQEISFGPEMMDVLRSLYQEKLQETQASIQRLQLLAAELQASISYTDLCQQCEPTTEASQCKGCEKHDRENSPMLISIIANSV
jgi:DNA-binding transcriptional MerR regulator